MSVYRTIGPTLVVLLLTFRADKYIQKTLLSLQNGPSVIFNFRCPPGCDCFGLSIDCSGKHTCYTSNSTEKTVYNITHDIDIPISTRSLDVSTNPTIFSLMNVNKLNLSLLTHLNLSYCEITHFKTHFFESMVKLKVLDISYNKFRSLSSNVFASLSVVEQLSLQGNFEPITFESNSFFGLGVWQLELSDLHIRRIAQNAFASLNLTDLKIFKSRIDIMETNSLGGLYVENMYVNSTKINEYYETMFHCVRGVKLLKTDEFKFCCVRPTSLSGDSCFPGPDEMSSCGDLIDDEVLRPLIWVIGIIAVISNASTVIFRIFQQREQLKRSYGIFVTNLSISDCIMGIYLLIIAGADSYFRDSYIFNDEKWRKGALCNFAGMLSTLSNESSLFFVGLITLDRLLLVKYPLRKTRFDFKNTCLLSLSVWCISIVLAIIPVGFSQVFEGKFYSQSGVCLALPITRARPPGYAYSVAVFLILNSVGYALIALGQWSIYKVMKVSSIEIAGSRSISTRDAKVATRLMLVAVSGLLSWLPVTVLGMKY